MSFKMKLEIIDTSIAIIDAKYNNPKPSFRIYNNPRLTITPEKPTMQNFINLFGSFIISYNLIITLDGTRIYKDILIVLPMSGNFLAMIKKRKFLFILLAIILIGIVLRIVIFGTVTTGHSQDSYWFITLGDNLIKNFRFELTEGSRYDFSQPLHPVLLGVTSLIFRDLYFNGKLFSLVMGVLVILFTYIFWKKVKGKRVALLASFFVAFAALSFKYSVAIREDSLFMVMLLLALFFIYKVKDSDKFMPVAGLFIMLAAFARWEGYLLIPAALISFLIWKRKEIFVGGGINFGFLKNKYFLIGLIIIVIPLFFWSLRSYNLCDCGLTGMIPSYNYQKQLSGAASGFSYLSGVPAVIPWYFVVFLFLGLIFSLKKYRKYFPIYLYLIFSLFIHMRFRGHSEQIVYITPILYGFMAIFILDIKKVFKNKKIFYILLSIFLVLFLVVGMTKGYSMTKKWGTTNDVIKDSMDWLKENSYVSDKVLVSDMIVYSYFIDNELVSHSYSSSWVNMFFQDNPGLQDIVVAYAAFLTSNDIKYFVAYDSTMPWFYHEQLQTFAKNFEERNIQFTEKIVRLIPLQRFEANGQEIILYEVQ